MTNNTSIINNKNKTGQHTKLSGTVKQMIKGTLWLHSNSYLKNSGIFVVKTRNCVVAGGKSATPQLSASYKGRYVIFYVLFCYCCTVCYI